MLIIYGYIAIMQEIYGLLVYVCLGCRGLCLIELVICWCIGKGGLLNIVMVIFRVQ